MRQDVLKDLNLDQARFIALLARTARTQRDAALGHVVDKDLGGIRAARGEHSPTAALGFDPLSAQNTQLAALRDALDALTPAGRSELYTLMRIGQGNLAANKWHRGLNEAQLLGDATVTAALIEDSDLYAHVSKGLYQTGLEV
jgi:hypothetical protein